MKGVKTVTKKSLVDALADGTELKRTEVRRVVQSLLDNISEHLAEGDRIELRDFGVFEVRTRAERPAQNPRTGEKVVVPERRTIKFKPGRAMQQELDRRSEQLALEADATEQDVDLSHSELHHAGMPHPDEFDDGTGPHESAHADESRPAGASEFIVESKPESGRSAVPVTRPRP